MAKLLLANDNKEFIDYLIKLLRFNDFEVEVAYNRHQLLNKLNDSYHLILLDIYDAEFDRLEILKQIRRNFMTPIVLFTDNESDCIISLELGADNYLFKPFDDRKLIAIINAILRRTIITASNKSSTNHFVKYNGLTLHPAKQQALYENKDLNLTATEFSLLYTLIINSGEILSREDLSRNVLGKQMTPFDRAIDMHMSNLRKKLPLRQGNQAWFKTLRGKGYQIIEPDI